VSRVDDLSLSLGVKTDLSALWHLTAAAGGQTSRSRFQQVSAAGAPLGFGVSSETGWLANLSLGYGGEYLSGSLNLVHDLTTASGRSGATRRNSGSLSLSERFTRRLTGSLALSYSWNKAAADQFSGTGTDEVTRNLNALLHYDLSDDLKNGLALEGSYSNTGIDYRLAGNRADQNVFMLRLSWQRLMFM